MTQIPISTKALLYFYPPIDPAPSGGEKVALLTVGNQQVVGNWTNDGRFKGWAHLVGRDKEKERQLGYLPQLPTEGETHGTQEA